MAHFLRLAVKISLFAVILLSWPDLSLAGFGVSPPGIIEDKLIRGSHLERTIYLVQGDPKENLDIEVTVDSTGIENWFSFEPGKNFTIPAGIQQFPLKVIINVPQDAEFNVYKAFIRVRTRPKLATGGGNVSIAVGGRIDANLTVGEGIFSDFKIRRIQILDIKEGEPLKASITIENLGNVPVKPERVSFELFSKYGDVRLAYSEVVNFKEIKPFETESFIVEFPVDIKLGIGEYWAAVKVYKDGNVLQEMKTVFNVYPKPVVKKDRVKTAVASAITAVILIIVVGVGLFFLRRRKISKI